MSLSVNLIRLRYRLWRLDQAEKMTARRAAWIVGVGSVAGFAAITALLHLPTGQYIAAVATYAASYGGIRACMGIARDFDRKEGQ